MNRSAFRAVGSHDVVNSPAVKPGAIPLAPGRSPQVSRRLDSSDQVIHCKPENSSKIFLKL